MQVNLSSSFPAKAGKRGINKWLIKLEDTGTAERCALIQAAADLSVPMVTKTLQQTKEVGPNYKQT